MHRMRTRYSGLLVGALLSACSGTNLDTQQSFVGKTWMSTDPSAPLGTLRIFLSDGTLVMDSCFETYRLARWHSIDDKRIEWEEDSARIEAEVTQITSNELQMRLHLLSEVKEEHYRLSRVPFLCPDSR